VFAQGDFDLHPRIGGIAQDFHDPSDRRRVSVGLRHDFGDDHLARPGLLRVLGRDENVLADAAVGAGDEKNVVLAVKSPDHAVLPSLHDLDDRRFGPAAPVEARLPDHDAVPVQHLAHLTMVQVHALPARIRRDEPVAVGMALDAPCGQVELAGDQYRPFAVAQDLALALHGGEPSPERRFIAFLQAQSPGQVALGERRLRLAEDLEDQLAACDRLFVTGRFAIAMRIAPEFTGTLFQQRFFL